MRRARRTQRRHRRTRNERASGRPRLPDRSLRPSPQPARLRATTALRRQLLSAAAFHVPARSERLRQDNPTEKGASVPRRSAALLLRAASRRTAAHCERVMSHPAEEALPPTAVREILRRIPADQRARAACVCRCWRLVVADPALWAVLDLSTASGVTLRLTPERLLAAAACAQGRLEVLNVPPDSELLPALNEIAAANAVTLRELRSLTFEDDPEDFPDGNGAEQALADLQALLLAAPALQVVEASMSCRVAMAPRLLCNQPPFGPLRLSGLDVDVSSADRNIAALVAGVAVHPSLKSLSLIGHYAHPLPLTPRELEMVAAAVVVCRLQTLYLHDCDLGAENVPALAELLRRSDSLTCLSIRQQYSWVQLLNADVAPLFAEALRANRTLIYLTLMNVLATFKDEAMLFLALVGHPSLRYLDCSKDVADGPLDEDERDAELVGMSLGALVAANSPALEVLDVGGLELGDVGMGPLCDALLRNTHLRRLDVQGNGTSAAFAAQRLLPAVRANDSLQHFVGDDVAAEAMTFVNVGRPLERLAG